MTAIQQIPQPRPPIRHRKQTYTAWQWFRSSFYDRRSILAWSFFAFGIIIVILVLDAIYIMDHATTKTPMDPIDAVVYALSLQAFNTNSDVSFNEPIGRVLVVGNVVFVLFFLQSLLDVARQIFYRTEERRHQLGLASVLRDHVIVCGLGRLGMRVVLRLLDSGIKVVVIQDDWNSEFVQRIVRRGVPVIDGDAREAEVLRLANIKHARSVVATADDDVINLSIVLASQREKKSIKVVLRSFSAEFDKNITSGERNRVAYSASELASQTFTHATLHHSLDYIFELGDTIVGVTEYKMPAGYNVGKITKEHNVRIINRDGSYLTVLGDPNQLEQLPQQNVDNQLGMTPPTLKKTGETGHIIICGLGKVGYRVVQRLRKCYPSIPLVIVQQEDDTKSLFTQKIFNEFESDINTHKIRFIVGDSRDEKTLEEAGVTIARTVATLTSNDQINVKTALEARRLQPGIHVVLRVFSESLADELTDLFEIRTVYGMSLLASPTIAATSLLSNVEYAFAIRERVYAVVKLQVESSGFLNGMAINSVSSKYNLNVIHWKRGTVNNLFPSGNTILAANDEVYLIGDLDVLRKNRFLSIAE
jgi:Trk K+ transport system NAD-binding subunit